jgi:hypothetical protein
MPKISKKLLGYTHSLSGQQTRKLNQVRNEAPSKESVFIRAYSGKSPGAGIKAHCLECVGCDTKAVRECTSSACPLWPYRPYQSNSGTEIIE